MTALCLPADLREIQDVKTKKGTVVNDSVSESLTQGLQEQNA